MTKICKTSTLRNTEVHREKWRTPKHMQTCNELADQKTQYLQVAKSPQTDLEIQCTPHKNLSRISCRNWQTDSKISMKIQSIWNMQSYFGKNKRTSSEDLYCLTLTLIIKLQEWSQCGIHIQRENHINDAE